MPVFCSKDDKDEMIFVGYSSTSKAFRIYNRSTRAITKSINVSFDEKGDMASDHPDQNPCLLVLEFLINCILVQFRVIESQILLTLKQT